MSLHLETPLFELMKATRDLKKPVFLKMECFQPTASFKIRGIGYLCEKSIREGKSQLISSSGGNAGLAVAYAGRKLGVKTTVIVPDTTPKEVRDRIEQEGAIVQIHGSVWDEADAFARSLADETQGAYISPFDHPDIWKGHATLIDEIIQQCPVTPDTIILSVGGGGLFCGVMEGLTKNSLFDTSVIAVETTGAASLYSSAKAGKIVTLDAINSIAKSLGAKTIAEKAFEYANSKKVRCVTVSDAQAVDSVMRFAHDQKVMVEPACGAALSIVYDYPDLLKTAKNVVVIVCGGFSTGVDEINHWKALLDNNEL